MLRVLCFSILLTALLSSCAGYRLGGAKPRHLAEVNSIAVPLFSNRTLDARISPSLSSAIVDALVQDGTYKVHSVDTADAILTGEVKKLDYTQLRSNEFDTLRSEELELRVYVEWTLSENGGGNRNYDVGSTIGRTSFFTEVNQATSRVNAKAEACRDAAQSIVLQIADGF